MASLNALISALDVLLSENIDDDALRCNTIANRLGAVLRSDCLPPEAKVAGEDCYQRHLIYQDPAGRFCVGSFVWKPGQETPIHDHACWGVFGVVRGCLRSENFVLDTRGELQQVSTDVVSAGHTAWLSPTYGDIHRMANREKKKSALSLHVYGAPFAEICRTRYDGVNGLPVPFPAPATPQQSTTASG